MIHTVSPMMAALHGAVSEYEPTHDGLALAREQQDASVSLSNLRLLHGIGKRLHNLIAGPGGLLFVFWTGEQYLATGLRVGEHPSVAALAELMAEWTFGEADELATFYSALGDDYLGPVSLGRD